MMDDWPPKFRLITVLATIKYLLSRSDRKGWGFEKADDIERQIDQLLSFIMADQGAQLPDHHHILFGPTGPLQEISIANGWSEVYMKLAEEYDKLEYVILENRTGVA